MLMRIELAVLNCSQTSSHRSVGGTDGLIHQARARAQESPGFALFHSIILLSYPFKKSNFQRANKREWRFNIISSGVVTKYGTTLSSLLYYVHNPVRFTSSRDSALSFGANI